MNNTYQSGIDYARQMDAADKLASFRSKFHIPKMESGNDVVYLCGNSLGLQPKTVKESIDQELLDWKNYGVEGHFHAKNPWMPYHEFLTDAMARVVGGKQSEVVVMNTLTVNLHLMMVSFYRPKGSRIKVIIESDAFPSDKYAVESQMQMHGIDPADALIELTPREGEHCLRIEDIEEIIRKEGEQVALIMIGNTNYYTGQYFDMKRITDLGHEHGAIVGFDCAHGAGNVDLQLHDCGVDFAVWCSYKYLNSGPGSLGGCFVHERHAKNDDLIRFKGWWGHNKETRFGMRDGFDAIVGAEGWQLSNPPILSMAAIKASLEIYDDATIANLRKKAISLTGYMEFLLHGLENQNIEIITPSDPAQRGSQLSIYVKNADKKLFDQITAKGVMADWREPGVIRVSAVPLYNSYHDVYRFVEILKGEL